MDGIAAGDPNGDAGAHQVSRAGAGRRRGSAPVEFRRYMTDSLAANVARSDKVLKFRLHLFEPPDLSRPDAAGVVHYEPPAQQYQAAYEIAFRNHLDMELFFASPEYAAAVREQARYVVQVSPFPERNAYTFVYDGRMTLAGQRGSRTAELITRSRRHQPAPGRHPRPGRRQDCPQRTDRRRCDQKTCRQQCECADRQRSPM